MKILDCRCTFPELLLQPTLKLRRRTYDERTRRLTLRWLLCMVRGWPLPAWVSELLLVCLLASLFTWESRTTDSVLLACPDGKSIACLLGQPVRCLLCRNFDGRVGRCLLARLAAS